MKSKLINNKHSNNYKKTKINPKSIFYYIQYFYDKFFINLNSK